MLGQGLANRYSGQGLANRYSVLHTHFVLIICGEGGLKPLRCAFQDMESSGRIWVEVTKDIWYEWG